MRDYSQRLRSLAAGLPALLIVLMLSSPSASAAAYLHEADFRSMADGPIVSTNGGGSADPYNFIDLSDYAPPGVAQQSYVTDGLLQLRPNLPASSSVGITHSSTFPPVADGTYTSGRANVVVGGYSGQDTADSTVSISMDSSNLTAPGGPFDYIGRFVRYYDGVTVAYEAKIMLRNGGFIDVASATIPEIKSGDILSIEWDNDGLVTLLVNNVPVLSYTVPVQDRFDTTTYNGVFFALDSSGENPPVASIRALSITQKGVNYAIPNQSGSSEDQQQEAVMGGAKLAASGVSIASYVVCASIFAVTARVVLRKRRFIFKVH